MATVYISNANDIVVENLTADATGKPIDDARITATIYDVTGTAVTNGLIQLPWVSSGTYRGTIPSTGSNAVALTAGASYSIVVAAGNYPWTETLYVNAQARNA